MTCIFKKGSHWFRVTIGGTKSEKERWLNGALKNGTVVRDTQIVKVNSIEEKINEGEQNLHRCTGKKDHFLFIYFGQ